LIINGSMRYSSSGRKKKNGHLYRRKKKSANAMGWDKPKRVAHADAKARKEIPSMKTTKYTPEVDNSWKIEESKKFTVAPAYNKGAYQVIPQSDIKHIGK